jgi:phosphoribosyl-ATP pyrophosphohydrolase
VTDIKGCRLVKEFIVKNLNECVEFIIENNSKEQSIEFLLEELGDLIVAIQHSKRKNESNIKKEISHLLLMLNVVRAQEYIPIEELLSYANEVCKEMAKKRNLEF